jgi:flagellar hook-length control protein FliK
LQQDALKEMEPAKKSLKAVQRRSTEETRLPVEKQYDQQELPEPFTVANSMKEGSMVSSLEKEPLVQTNTNSVELVKQVIHQLNGKLKNGPTSMHLQLNPEALGAIDVDVVRDATGVQVTFFVEQAGTGKLLESQLSQLRQSLADSGVQLSGLNIGQNSYTGQEGGFHHQSTSFAPHTQREAFQSKNVPQESSRAERVTGQTSEVDYLI